MFEEWGFLISEMMMLIILAAVLGLFVGWIIWGRRSGDSTAKVEKLDAELVSCREDKMRLQNELAQTKADCEASKAEALMAEEAAAAAAAEASAVAHAAQVDAGAHPVEVKGEDFDAEGHVEEAGTKPLTLDAARDGKPDDLKQISGIGPKLEILCNKLGFYHFDQIAAWTTEEVAWVDTHLEGFKGRVSRDNWVEQAKVLAEGGTTAFSERVKGGGVYE